MLKKRPVSRRDFLKGAAAAAFAAPVVMNARAFGANDQITMGFVGMGGQGTGDMSGFVGFKQVRGLAVCDVVGAHRERAKSHIDGRNGNTDCASYTDFRQITDRADIDAVFCGTPDHWHALITIAAMKSGKDVYCEKPETLTIGQGRVMTETARRYGRVFSGGSQRVWGDYNWFHRMVWGGGIGKPLEGWVNVGGPSGECYLPPVEVPGDTDWDMWLGPAPVRPFHPSLIRGGFRPFRDYSGGDMTDWGCHGFGGALYCLQLHQTGPVQIIPPDGKEYPHLTYIFANGIRIYHGGGWGGILSFRGTDGEIPARGKKAGQAPPPNVYVPNYKGNGGIFGDFLHCVRTRQRPFRDIEIAHRTATHSHLGNIAYWLKRPLKWDPEKEEIIGDPEAARWLDRPMREPWTL